METITIDNFPMTLLEVRGEKNLWKYYYPNNKALIFVVDSANEKRFQKAREELFELLVEPDLANCPLLIVANKQDMANAKTPEELKEMLNLDSIRARKMDKTSDYIKAISVCAQPVIAHHNKPFVIVFSSQTTLIVLEIVKGNNKAHDHISGGHHLYKNYCLVTKNHIFPPKHQMIQYKFSSIFTKIGFCASFLANSFFIYLTLFHIKHVVGTYKKLVIFFALTGIVFSGIEIFAKPFSHNFNNSMIYFSLSITEGPEWVSQFVLLLWAGFYSLIVAAVAVQFVFRYLCLLGADLTKQAKWYKDIVWVFYPLVPATVFGSCLYVFSLPDDYSDSYVRNAIFEHYSLVLSKVPRFIMVPYAADGSIRLKNMSYLGISCLIVSFHYSFILYCGLKMHFEMKKELKKFSVANRKLQRQFFKALIFQSLGPTFFIFLPAIPVLMIPLLPPSLEIRISWQTGWLFSIIGAYPPFDSIAFMMIVSEYKKLIERRYLRIFSIMTEKSSGADSSGSVQKMRRIVVA
ncbi:hypothetical protein CAEBREN_30952 [Caenorhabditis brenneri]|uniref:Uncharacterized protein n=1 Tax=Caenorhabditis brenneri TaxID=135651 RepID=G0P673_CAEBE|nr:hypothetical protein CAEBREN_30952 [Caenorhabditis brenneri]